MSRITLLPVFAVLISAPAFAALPSDCVQSNYPVRVIPACTDILSREPSNGVAYFKRGKAYLDYRTDTRDLALAIADLTKAIEIDPKYADAYLRRGIAFRRNGDVARAIADHNKAIEINPAFARAYYARAYAHQQQQGLDLALADYSKAIELDPAFATAYFRRAFVHILRDDGPRAAADLKQATKLGGRDFDYLYDTLKPTEHSQVVNALNKAIEINARDAAAYYNRGLAYSEIDERTRAIADFDKAIEIDPAYLDALLSRGANYAAENYDDPRALADFNRVIELDPKDSRAYVTRGVFYGEQIPEQIDRAMADLNKAVELNPKNDQAYLRRGFIHALSNQHALAKADFAKVLDIEWRLWAAIKGLYPNYLDEIEAERQTKPQ